MGNINDDLLDFDIPTWAVTSLVNSDDSGLEDDDIEKLNKFTDEIVAKYGNANFMMGSDEEMESQFKYKNDIDGVLGADVVTMYLQPTKNYAKGNTVKGMQVLEISIEQGKSRSIPKVKRIGSSYPYKNYLGVYSVNTLEEANELVKDISDFIIYKIKYFDGEGVGLPKYAIYIAENNYAKGTTVKGGGVDKKEELFLKTDEVFGNKIYSQEYLSKLKQLVKDVLGQEVEIRGIEISRTKIGDSIYFITHDKDKGNIITFLWKKEEYSDRDNIEVYKYEFSEKNNDYFKGKYLDSYERGLKKANHEKGKYSDIRVGFGTLTSTTNNLQQLYFSLKDLVLVNYAKGTTIKGGELKVGDIVSTPKFNNGKILKIHTFKKDEKLYERTLKKGESLYEVRNLDLELPNDSYAFMGYELTKKMAKGTTVKGGGVGDTIADRYARLTEKEAKRLDELSKKVRINEQTDAEDIEWDKLVHKYRGWDYKGYGNYAKGTTIKFDKLPKNRQANKNDDYFAVGKIDGKIVESWEIVDDVESLKYYAKIDLKDNDYNPKNFNIVSAKYLIRKGINPFDYNNWRKIDYSTNESAYATKFLEGEIYANGGGITKKPTQSQLDKMTAFNLMDAMKNDKKNYQLYKKQLLKLYPDAKGFSNGGGIDENDIKQGDYVDFESYGEFYVCNPSYSDNYFWVTKEKEDRYDSNAQGYSVPKSSAIEIIETDEEYADGGGIKAIFSKEGIEASNPFAFKKKLEFAKKHPELLMLETGGGVDMYSKFDINKNGTLSATINDKNYEVIYRDDISGMYDLFENDKKIKSSKVIRDLMQFPKEYNNGGGVDIPIEWRNEIKLEKGKYLICLSQWNRIVKRGILKSDDKKNAKDWRPAKKSTNCKWSDMGSPYDERYMYSPLYDQLRYQDEGEWYSYGSVSDTFAKGTTIEEFNYNPKIDYLSEYHLLPKKVQDIIFKEEYEDSTYESNNKLIKELNGIGWTADYDLSASIYDLKPIDKYAKGNTIEGEKSVKISGFPPIKLSSAKILYKDFEENFNSDLFRFVKHYNSLHKAKNTIADYKMVLEFGSDKKLKISRFEIGGKIDNGYFNNCFLKSIFGV